MAYQVGKALLKILLWFVIIIIFLSQQKIVLPATSRSPLADMRRDGIKTTECFITLLNPKGTLSLWRVVITVGYTDGTKLSRLYAMRPDEPKARKKALLDCDDAISHLKGEKK